MAPAATQLGVRLWALCICHARRILVYYAQVSDPNTCIHQLGAAKRVIAMTAHSNASLLGLLSEHIVNLSTPTAIKWI